MIVGEVGGRRVMDAEDGWEAMLRYRWGDVVRQCGEVMRDLSTKRRGGDGVAPGMQGDGGAKAAIHGQKASALVGKIGHRRRLTSRWTANTC